MRLESNLPPATGATLTRSERGALIRDGLLNYGGNLVSAVATILLVPIMLRTLGAQAYGLWIATLALAAIFAAFDFGLGSAVIRVVAGGGDREPGSRDARFVRAAESLYVWFGVAGAVLLCVLGVRAIEGRSLAGPEMPVRLILACCAIALVADQLIAFVSSVLGGLRRFDALSRILVAVTISRSSAILLVLAAGGRLKAVALAYASVSVLAVWSALRVLRGVDPRYRVHLGWPGIAAVRPYLAFGLSSFLVVVMSALVWQAAPALIGFVLGTAAVPFYYAAQKFPLGVTAISSRLSIVFFPAASRDASEVGPSRARDLVFVGTRWVLSVALPFCVILAVLAPALLRAWLGVAPVESVHVLRLTCVAVLADALAAAPLQILWGRGAVAPLVRIFLLMGTGSVAITLLFMPVLGSASAAWGLVAAVTGGAWALLIAAARRLEIRARELAASVAAGLAIPALAAGATAWVVSRIPIPGRWAGLIAAAALGFLAYVVTFSIIGARGEERAFLAHFSSAVLRRISDLLRKTVRRLPPLRSAIYLSLAVLDRLRENPKRRAAMSGPYEQVDPWGYETAWGVEHLRAAAELLDAGPPDGRFRRACELGCGEGFGTRVLAPRCQSVIALDVVPAALERARQRLQGQDHVRFDRWDVLADGPLPDQFDLVVCMGFLECFLRRSDLRRIRRKILAMMEPGGYLLVTTTRQHPVVEAARWSRWLVRGSEAIHEFLMASGELTLLRSTSTPTHLFTLYRKRRASS